MTVKERMYPHQAMMCCRCCQYRLDLAKSGVNSHGEDNVLDDDDDHGEYSGAGRSQVRSHPGQQSEMMPVTIPG